MAEITLKGLQAFIDTIENTGGVVQHADGTFAPACDDEWIDLGDAYVEACKAIDREPLIRDCDDCNVNEDGEAYDKSH